MTRPPNSPKIYHITHWRNLEGIASAGVLWSDAKRIEIGLPCELVGMSSIKRRRLTESAVKCYPGTMVGEYVPWYFCPRSIMLFLLHKGNHPELTYQGGQTPIVHLQADLSAVVGWANRHGVRWAFTDRNAGSRTAQFWNRTDELHNVDWSSVEATDFRDMTVKEGKQAEFLVHNSFPWNLVETIGVKSEQTRREVVAALETAEHRPAVLIEPSWYF